MVPRESIGLSSQWDEGLFCCRCSESSKDSNGSKDSNSSNGSYNSKGSNSSNGSKSSNNSKSSNGNYNSNDSQDSYEMGAQSAGERNGVQWLYFNGSRSGKKPTASPFAYMRLPRIFPGTSAMG